ncbi:MotE family protein [Aureimonas jatrophae]|uniref:Flagellar motility protein MotE, a chaperone for MotC folding n=1 Tax=Aureimonas jatrophae TaxID=1166073 RepID=A0A1H0JEU8_9HYPH|nr:MotE family protein [Aureimonas jatrophae]MBB3951441.1 flagellar motility protein MotE (MotC chaperone) [Aureimonas jatrophae]SDO42278.1 Flagellar motility protein MotE, a chaperone for MotC folding [Aureimonas jatrophae]
MTRTALNLALVAFLAAVPAHAEEASGGAAAPAAPAAPAKVRVVGPNGQAVAPAEPAPMSDVERYCANIADPALDARNALQLKKVQEAEGQLSERIDQLEAKRQEVQGWIAERKAFLDSTAGIMTDIYSAMKPDAAAAQLAGLERPVAASLLTRLKSRQASAILAEMPAPVAAELADLIVRKTDRGATTAATEAPSAGSENRS